MISLGATLPLSGEIAPYGILIRDGIELAASDLSKEGINITTAYEDVPAPGPSALSSFNKLIIDKRIQGLVANFWNPVIPIIAPAVKHFNTIVFHSAAADDLILDAGDTIFSTNSKIKDEALKLANFAYNQLGASSSCILYVGTSFGENYNKHFSDQFQSLGGKVSYSELSKLGERDLRTVLTKIKYNSCQVFLAAFFGTNLGLVLKQAKEVGISKPIISVYEAEDPSVIEVAGDAAEGLRFFAPEATIETNSIKDYKLRFIQKFGYAPRILASNAYDATIILSKAINQCKADRDCIKNKIYSIKNFEGMSGTFSIDADGAARKEFVLKTVKDGKFQRILD